MTLQTPEPTIRRDHNGRPYIKTPDGKEATYTRTTTFVKAYEDTWLLEQWKMRQAAIGLSLRPDLQLAVHAHREDKSKMNGICKEALDAAAASAAATTGTAVHSLTEQHDRGLPLPVNLPPETLRDIEAYRLATAELQTVHIEKMTVYDEWKVAGTPDRVVLYQGRYYIADLKTGSSVDFSAGTIAAQLAMYAHGLLYDIATGERTEHGASQDKGIVIHLPAGTGQCDVQWIDLRAGWEVAKVCKEVRAIRNLSAGQLYTALGGKNDKTLNQILANVQAETPPPSLTWGVDEIGAALVGAATRAELAELWARHQSTWTEDLTRLATERYAELAS